MWVVTLHSDGVVEYSDGGRQIARIVKVRRQATKALLILEVAGVAFEVEVDRDSERIRKVPR